MRYLLDTPLLVAYLKGSRGGVSLVDPWVRQQEAATSVIAYGEAIEYFKGSPRYLYFRAQLRALLKEVTAYALSYPILERYADIRRTLRPRGQLIRDMDTLIAATALVYHLTVVTLDSDFGRVPGLAVQRYTRADLA